MKRLFTTLIVLLSITSLARAGEAEHIMTQKEFGKLVKASRQEMQTFVDDYCNSLSSKKCVQFTKEQSRWLKDKQTQCDKMPDFASIYDCLSLAYGRRIRDIETMLVMELKKKHVSFSLPKFPLNLSYGTGDNRDELKMDILEDGRYSFSFTVYGGRGHVCSGDGIAVFKGESFLRLPDSIQKLRELYPAASESSMSDLNELNNGCTLEITFSPHFVIFAGDGNCHEYFICGMRTRVYGEFKRDDFHIPKK